MNQSFKGIKTLLILFFSSQIIYAQTITGKVVAVKDGDTIEVLNDSNKVFRIRFYGIDCPEHSQAFGMKAKQFTSDNCFGKRVKVEVKDTDRYGRTVGIVILPDSTNLNYKLVENGLAWHYKAFSKDPKLAELELQAKQKKLGLWADENPTAPWEFRKNKN